MGSLAGGIHLQNPRLPDFWISPSSLPSYLHKVSDIIHPTTLQWQLDIITSISKQYVALSILPIRYLMVPRNLRDKWIWTTSPKGLISVKSAYQTIWSLISPPSTSPDPCIDPTWTSLEREPKSLPALWCLFGVAWIKLSLRGLHRRMPGIELNCTLSS